MDHLTYIILLNGLFGLVKGFVGPNCPKNYMFSCQPMVVPIPCHQQQQQQLLQPQQQQQQQQQSNIAADILLTPPSAIASLVEQQQQLQQQLQQQQPQQLHLQLQQPELKSTPLISVMPLRHFNYLTAPSQLPFVAEIPCQRSSDAARDAGLMMKNDKNERIPSVPSTINYPFPTTDKYVDFSKSDNVEVMGKL